ncbi:MAG: cell division protein FtsW [Deltaproteobacteria bacterium GWC2_42_11]|nr:MAG: cell division protein FtsW [Deltaproteobacteria bacterium GWC2_42_11]HBO83687.1 putative lipid II flippase FtsW [Deltaproteobacteria bacterium]
MIKAREIDKLLIISTLLLFATGVLMTYSTTYIMAIKRYGDGYFFMKKHLWSGIIALTMFMISMRVPYQTYRRFVYPLLILSVIMLILVLMPGIGHTVGGARRWLKIGSFTFQPSEFAKLSVIIYLAYSLSKKKEKVKIFSIGFLPHIVVTGAVMLLVLMERDFGTTMSLGAIALIMMFAAGVRISHIMSIFAAAIPFVYIIVTKKGYMMDRIMVFLNPWEDPAGKGFQIIQSFLAFGAGGVWGTGLGEGKQKLFYLPEAHTDFIFSVIGEELGLIGIGAIIFLYLVFLISGIRISLRAPDLYGTYLAIGLTLLVSLQAVVNMAVVTGLLPTKGLTLPFISYGGTSLLVNMIGVGMLLNIYIKGQET